MEQIKLIACDLDGTLLLNGAQSLQPDTFNLIRRLQEKGILFFAASGRQYTNLQRLFAPLRDEIGYLCENGCLAFFNGKQLFRERMDHALGQELIRAILAKEGAEVLVDGERCCYVQPKDMQFYYHMRDVVRNDVVLTHDILHTPEEYMKISVYEPEGIRDKEYWRSRFGSRCTVETGGNVWLDMMPFGVSKGTGLQKILEALGIPREACMAIGDNENDREMLKLAGIPVAMETSRPEIIRLAGRTTDTVEHLLRKLL